jgi:hypothetical protein
MKGLKKVSFASKGRQRTMALIALQSFEGSFELSPELATVLGLQWASLEPKFQEFALNVAQASSLTDDQKRNLFATLLVVAAFQYKLATYMEVWELVVEKAKAWMADLVGGDKAVLKVEALLQEVKAQAQF